MPPKTPGPTGHQDASSPLLTTLLGYTPNLTGLRDWVDETLHDIERWWSPAPGKIGKDPHHDQPVAKGQPPLVPAVGGEVSLADAQDMALRISTTFEGGVALNYKALADDGDKQATSFGLIQWNFGQNTLGPLLNKMRAKNAAAFDACFGADADYATLKTALAANDGPGQCAWARGLLKTKAGRAAWKAAFHAIGSNDDFNKIQHDEALAKYSPMAAREVARCRKLSPDLFKRIEFRTYAALYDLCVQQGSLDRVVKQKHPPKVLADCVANIQARVLAEKPATQLAFMEIAVQERGKMASDAWKADAISRRMGILTGAAYASSEGSSPKTRKNPQYAFITQHGTQYVTGL
ncbi:MAG TPA: hypothetical protein VF457_08700 [Burkholderiaceae bacterium]